MYTLHTVANLFVTPLKLVLPWFHFGSTLVPHWFLKPMYRFLKPTIANYMKKFKNEQCYIDLWLSLLFSMQKPAKTTVNINLSVVYVDRFQWEWINLIWKYYGYSPRSLFRQALHTFFVENREYYAQAAIRDAESREMSAIDHYRCLRFDKKLKPVIRPVSHPPSPIAWVDGQSLIQPSNRRCCGVLDIPGYTYTLLRFAILLDGGSFTGVVSKCLHAYFGEFYQEIEDNPRSGSWAKIYYPEIKLDKDCCYTRDIWNKENQSGNQSGNQSPNKSPNKSPWGNL